MGCVTGLREYPSVGSWASHDYTEEIARTQYNSEKRVSAIEKHFDENGNEP